MELGAKIGWAMAAVIVVGLLVFLAYYFINKEKKDKEKKDGEKKEKFIVANNISGKLQLI